MAVVEAGLGGRYDATSVVDAGVTVLTNVGLEHTRWLGPTVSDIAEEKLAVVRPDAALVVGAGPRSGRWRVAERVADERSARIVTPRRSSEGSSCAPAGFPARNFALASAAAEAHLRRAGRRLMSASVRAGGRATEIRDACR